MNRSTLSQILIPIAILILFVVGIYGVVKVRNNAGGNAPSLSVNVEDKSTTTNDKLLLSGSTDGKELSVNGNKVDVGSDGTFTYQLPLVAGANKITFSATSNGKTTTVERTITRQVAVTKQPQTGGGLSNSGPAENVGIIGLTGLVLAVFYYFRSRNKGDRDGYKLFTKS